MASGEAIRRIAAAEPVALEFIQRAVAEAEPNALRTALFQATGDLDLLKLRQVVEVIEKGHLSRQSILSIAQEDRAELREKAARYLFDNQGSFSERTPTDDELRSLIELALGRSVSDEQFPELKSEASFEDFPLFLARWADEKEPDSLEEYKVVIVGTGHSGIAMGVHLKTLGIPFTIYERRSEIGGVWSINRYPDIRVDTMSATFQMGFVKRYPWSEYFARGAEVQQYMTNMARNFGVYEHIKFDHDVDAMRFDEATSRWEIDIVHSGEVTHDSAAFVIAATGLFSNPKNLDIPGIEDFDGPLLHTTHWPDDLTLEGKSVAIIGSGSSGTQLLSRVAGEAQQVYAYVRTPQWITSQIHSGDPISPEFRWLLDHMPYYWNWDRFAWLAPSGEAASGLFVPDHGWIADGGHFSEMSDELRARLTSYIKDQTGGREDLYSRLIPDCPPWARRMIVDNNWYKTLTEDHVELVTDGIDRIEADAIITVDGKRREVDVIVAAAGFDVTKYMFPIEVHGRGGTTVEERWERDGVGPRAFWSITIPGFPNLFMMYGPNSQGGAGGGLSSMLQLWTTHIANLIVGVIERGAKAIEPKDEAFEEHNRDLDSRTSKLIWMEPNSKDKNYYVSHGRVQSMNAWLPGEHWEAMTDPPIDRDFLVT